LPCNHLSQIHRPQRLLRPFTPSGTSCGAIKTCSESSYADQIGSAQQGPTRLGHLGRGPAAGYRECAASSKWCRGGIVTHSPSHTQRSAILHLLQAAQPGWVPAPALAKISLQYSARIFELRKEGWTISNRVVSVSGKKHGSFRLGPPETPRSAELRARPERQTPDAAQVGLFHSPAVYHDPEEGALR
jgi:hypothetical protein